MIRYLILAFALGGCTLFQWGPPSNLDSACAITRERPHWYYQMRDVEREYGLPVSVQMAMIWQESKFESRAKTPRRHLFGIIPWKRQSTAYGYSQAIDGTWDWYQEKTGRHYAKRHRFGDSVEFMGWYSDRTSRKFGVSKSDIRRQYLAYHEGHGGYARRTYKKKPWLMRVAGNLVDREAMYRRQLKSCPVGRFG